ncbi:hypothetical protein [Paraconexibacter algicola]|uniref:hypothetical protein n=1 Tax=Paraconexibacter algicola TaxID=2133960 RepID=UPI0013050296|nr:hypothetical protein [Paraconexibacter algicola]
MSRTNHPRPVRRTVRRHSGDVEFHIDNAIRSINHVIGGTQDPAVRAIADRIRVDLVAAKNASEALIRAAGREHAALTGSPTKGGHR